MERYRWPALAALLLGTTAALAQTATSVPSVDIAVTYAAIRSSHTNGASLWLESGGGVDLHATLYRGLGIVASVSGAHAGSNNSQVAPLDLITAVFGPRYTWQLPNRERPLKVSLFAQAFVGEANGFHSVFTTGSGPVNGINGTTPSANSLALQTGGGMNIRLTQYLMIRPLEANYLRTQLPNGGGNVQNNLRLSAGFVFRIR